MTIFQDREDFFRPDDFAILLGLKPDEPAFAADEFEKVLLLVTFFQRNRKEPEVLQDAIRSRFCAYYLPDTVLRFLDLPPLGDVTDREFGADYKLFNAFSEMLNQIQNDAYYTKYFCSTKALAAPGKRLPAVLAQRLLDLAPRLDRRMLARPTDRSELYYENFTGSCIHLLSTLLAFFVKVPDQEIVVPEATRRGLKPWLLKWTIRYGIDESDIPLGRICLRTLHQLFPETEDISDVKVVRKSLRNLDVCALPSCGVKANRKLCARCKTVCYCSVEHQRAHWNCPYAPHKLYCHETAF